MRIQATAEDLATALDTLQSTGAFQETLAQLAAGGDPNDMLKAMSVYPPVLEAMEVMGQGVYPGGVLPRPLQELVILRVSSENACQFCTNSHVDFARALGISEEPLEMLQHPEHLAPEHAVALEYVDAVRTRSTLIPDELFARLGEHYSQPEIVALTFLIGYINMLNWFNNALDVEYRGEFAPKRE